MPYTLHVELHPLGVVVNDSQERELLIEGESCCGVPFEKLLEIAKSSQKIEVDDMEAAWCRLR